MKPYQEGVVVEKSYLDTKIIKLELFMDGSVYPTLDNDERSRLTRQLAYMNDYSAVLAERIEAFN